MGDLFEQDIGVDLVILDEDVDQGIEYCPSKTFDLSLDDSDSFCVNYFNDNFSVLSHDQLPALSNFRF